MFLHSGTIHALTGPSKGVRLIFQFDVEILYSLREFQSLLFSFPSFFILRRNLKDPTYTAAESLLLSAIWESRHKRLLWEASLYALVLELYHPAFSLFCSADAGIPRKRRKADIRPSGKSSLSGKISGRVPVSEPESLQWNHSGNGSLLCGFFQISFFQAF